MNIKEIIIGRVTSNPRFGEQIMDSESNHIADARGWGRLQYEKGGEDKIEFLTQFITDAINEKLERGI